MHPAQLRLELDRGTTGQLDLGLIPRADPVVLERADQLGQQPRAEVPADVLGRVVDLDL